MQLWQDRPWELEDCCHGAVERVERWSGDASFARGVGRSNPRNTEDENVCLALLFVITALSHTSMNDSWLSECNMLLSDMDSSATFWCKIALSILKGNQGTTTNSQDMLLTHFLTLSQSLTHATQRTLVSNHTHELSRDYSREGKTPAM